MNYLNAKMNIKDWYTYCRQPEQIFLVPAARAVTTYIVTKTNNVMKLEFSP